MNFGAINTGVAPGKVNGIPLYFLNFVRDENMRESVQFLRTYCSDVLGAHEILFADLIELKDEYNLILVAHGNASGTGLYAFHNQVSAEDSTRNTVIATINKARLSTPGITNIFACVCSGSCFESSTSSGKVRWSANAFGVERAADFVKFLELRGVKGI